MNATASTPMRAGNAGATSLQRTVALLRASSPHPAVRLACMTAMVGLLACAVLAAAYIPQDAHAADTVLVLVSMTVAVPWGLWFSRLLLLRLEARAWRMPALPAAIPVAISHLLLASVVLPAVLLALLAGVGPLLPAVSSLLLAATAALLLAMLPRWFYLAACFAPLAWVVLGSFATRIWGSGILRVDFAATFASWQLPWMAVLASLAASWRWRAIVHGGDMRTASAWRVPTVLTSQSTASWGNAANMDANQWQAQMPDWLWPAGRVDQAGRARPLRAMRAILGTPFAPLSRAQVAVQAGFVLLSLLALVLLATGDTDQAQLRSLVRGGVSGALGGGGLVLVSLYGWRLDLLRRRPAAEMAELALLPGWENARHARRTLLVAVSRPLLLAAGLAVGILMPICILGGVGAGGMAWLLAAIVGLCLLAALSCLRPLSGKPMVSAWMLVLMGLVMVMVVATSLAIQPGESASGWLAGGWGVVYLACGIGMAASWRRFQARPHPFLQG